MKTSIEGFNQEYCLKLKKKVLDKGKEKTIKIDCTDLVILRWFVDFYPVMKKWVVDGKEYAWLTHKKIAEDLPIIDISKRGFSERLQKLVEFKILTYQLVKEGGTFAIYGFGENYKNLIQTNKNGSSSTEDGSSSTEDGMQFEQHGVCSSNNIGYVGQPTNKDKTINNKTINNKTIINNNNIYSAATQNDNIPYDLICEHLNKRINASYKSSTKKTKDLIKARFNEGFTFDDFIIVIDKKCVDWINDKEMKKYLRPETLFGTKFESYLNQPMKNLTTRDIASKVDIQGFFN